MRTVDYTRWSKVGRGLALVCIIAVAAAFAGCSKQRAELKLKSADKNIKQAKEWNAEKFDESKSTLQAAEQAADSARQSVSGGQGPQALTQATDAANQAKAAVEGAKTRFADEQLKAARLAVQVAQINDGQNQNNKLFESAQESLAEAEERYTKRKYEQAIEAASRTQTEVDQLLASLKNSAENRLQELEQKLKELESAKASEFLPNSIIKTNEAIGQIRQKVEQDRDYKQGIILAGTAITDAESAIVETKRRHSQQELQTLESKISEAIAEEAPIYAPDMLKTSQESFEEILRSYYENQFDTVLGAAELLKPKVEELIIVTRIEATKDKINTVEAAIRRFRDQDVEVYLPGRIKVMEELHARAQDLFNNSDYDGAKEQAANGLIEQDRITAAFDGLAEQAIQTADRSYASAKSTFDKMGEIFGGGPGQVVDQRIEAQRQTETANLSARLDNSLSTLQSSQANRREREFKKSIEQAKESEAVSAAVINGTFGIVAQHAVLKIQDEISQLERMGAGTRASGQLAQAKEIVEQTQKLVAENQNRDAARMAAKARAYVENVKQALARSAVTERKATEDVLLKILGTPTGGGTDASPASGGSGRQPGEYPGGSDLNNKESMDDLGRMLSAGPESTKIIVAQTDVQTPAFFDNYVGNGQDVSNSRIPSGTWMTDQPPSQQPSPAPNQRVGAIVGTRPEPVVPTRESASGSGSLGSYEGVTAPGPFVAVTGGATMSASASGGVAMVQPDIEDSALTIRRQVQEILADETRLHYLREYEAASVETARVKLEESGQALQRQDYAASLALAEDAQRILLEAEAESSRRAAIQNLNRTVDRINLAEAAQASMFAPAQMAESIRLHDQAKAFLDRGEYVKARELSEKALVAADDARLYNVNKARDLASLSTRYGGWKASHPLLLEAEMVTRGAEQRLDNPDTALQGQECAKHAVTLAQMALDHARDFTYQERIENIYRALNVALRAGANYFNVTEIKRLMAEISEVREIYVTRNFDAVELRLRDIEAGLARVIETTPLVLEENLEEVTAKLNALVEARAEWYVAQDVDDVKSLMNRAVIDFRKKDYYSSYTNLKNAVALTDRIEMRLQELVYYDAVTELFAQLDDTFARFPVATKYNREFVKKLVTDIAGDTKAVALNGRVDPNEFLDEITDIYLRAIHLKPPKSIEATHQQVLVCIKTARIAAINYQKILIMDQLSKPDAYEVLDTAANLLDRARKLRAEIQYKMIDPEARTYQIRAEKIVNY